MLQVAGRNARIRHKALLTAPTAAMESSPRSVVEDQASVLPGDAFERMCQDPDLVRMKQRFLAAAATVVILSITAVGLHLNEWDSADSPLPVASLAPQAAPAPSNERLKLESPTIAPDDSLKRITFRSASVEEAQGLTSDEVQMVLERFLKSATVDERLALVHEPLRVESSLRAYYRKHPIGAISYLQIEPRLGDKGPVREFEVLMPDGTRKFAAVITSEQGLRVDWPSFASLGDLEWSQMRHSRPVKPVLMRVLATASRHFGGPFTDTEKLSCLRLVPADDPDAVPVHGYFPRESELGRQIAALNVGEPLRLTVKLSYPEKVPASDQAWLVELVTPGWVVLPPSNGTLGSGS